jgi:hypothetical protein
MVVLLLVSLFQPIVVTSSNPVPHLASSAVPVSGLGVAEEGRISLGRTTVREPRNPCLSVVCTEVDVPHSRHVMRPGDIPY